MNTFRIYASTSGAAQAVKQGWSWPAFLFGPVWAISVRLWVIGIILLSVEVAFYLGASVVSNPSYTSAIADDDMALIGLILLAFWAAVRLLFGYYGNSWKESRLIRRGLAHTMTSVGDSKSEVLSKFGAKSPSAPAESTRIITGDGKGLPNAPSLSGSARWYRSLTRGQAILLWGGSVCLVPFFGIGIAPLLFLLYLHLGDRGI